MPLLVVAGLAASAYLTMSVRVPDSIPDYALQAAAVYRLEVGAACFVVLYLAAMAFFLALEGRGIAELGTRGLRATEVVRVDDRQRETLSAQMKLIHNTRKDLEDLEVRIGMTANDLNGQEHRLKRLEERIPG